MTHDLGTRRDDCLQTRPLQHAAAGRSSLFAGAEPSPGEFRIGMTKFATRMLGDFVEMQFTVAVGDKVEIGQPIGTIEGFKAVSDIYCVADGVFLGANPRLDTEPTLLEREPYSNGWLYRVQGERPLAALDVHGYIGLLDATIERMLLEQQQGKSC
jgi:glycine cleavage system H protein